MLSGLCAFIRGIISVLTVGVNGCVQRCIPPWLLQSPSSVSLTIVAPRAYGPSYFHFVIELCLNGACGHRGAPTCDALPRSDLTALSGSMQQVHTGRCFLRLRMEESTSSAISVRCEPGESENPALRCSRCRIRCRSCRSVLPAPHNARCVSVGLSIASIRTSL
jgi:hypothetical protein